MPDASRTFKPLHAILAAMGLVFTLSACAYAVMALRNMNPDRQTDTPHDGHLLIELFDQYGAYILLVELALLAILAAAAIGTEARRTRREQAQKT